MKNLGDHIWKKWFTEKVFVQHQFIHGKKLEICEKTRAMTIK